MVKGLEIEDVKINISGASLKDDDDKHFLASELTQILRKNLQEAFPEDERLPYSEEGINLLTQEVSKALSSRNEIDRLLEGSAEELTKKQRKGLLAYFLDLYGREQLFQKLASSKYFDFYTHVDDENFTKSDKQSRKLPPISMGIKISDYGEKFIEQGV